jgi:hypothetical protein
VRAAVLAAVEPGAARNFFGIEVAPILQLRAGELLDVKLAFATEVDHPLAG